MSAETSQFIAAAFNAWRKAGIVALVLRNYQGLPNAFVNDIDLLFAPGALTEAESVLLTTARQHRFSLHNRAKYATLALYYHSASGAQVHFDLFSGFTWRGLPYLDAHQVLKHRRTGELFDVPAPLHEQGINLLTGLVYSGRVKSKYRDFIRREFECQSGPAMGFLAPFVGPNLVEQLLNRIQTQDWEGVERRAGAVRRALLAHHFLRSPVKSLQFLSADAWRLAWRVFRPPGLALVLCGPDGCGKSTVGPTAAIVLDPSFASNKGMQVHWKPAVFSGRRREARGPSTNPHGQRPRPPLLSSLFFAAHWLEFLLGWHLRIRPVLFRGGLVMIDRWYYDFFVDQRRYRLSVPKWLVRAGYKLLPSPDLVCLLDAPVEVLRKRKQEVTQEETERQRAGYLALMDELPNSRVIRADQTPERVAADIAQAALTASAARM